MNARLIELAEQAGITTNLDTDYFERDMNKWVDYYSEKFAELIIAECVDIADDYVKDYCVEEHIKYNHPKSKIGLKIKEHFGIENKENI
jgi:hypothetical protein